MTWIVKVALERPYTFIVMALLIVIFGPLAAMQMPTDIFPAINIPVIGVAFNYTNLSPSEMAGRIVTPYERILSTTVNDIEHIESQSMQGIGVVKIFFQPTVDIRTASAQVTAISQSAISIPDFVKGWPKTARLILAVRRSMSRGSSPTNAGSRKLRMM